MRALELLRQLFQTLSKYQPESSQGMSISPILRRQVVTTMLDVISDFEFSNVASQLAIQVLDFLKSAFDESDLELLKLFVRTQLSHERAYLRFPTATDSESASSSHHGTRQATRGHLAAVIKMALVLKKLTLEGGMLGIGSKKSNNDD